MEIFLGFCAYFVSAALAVLLLMHYAYISILSGSTVQDVGSVLLNIWNGVCSVQERPTI